MYEDSAQKMERFQWLGKELSANYESLKAHIPGISPDDLERIKSETTKQGAIIDRGLAILAEAIAIVREIQDAFPDEATRDKVLSYLLDTEAWYEHLETLRLAAYEAAKRELRAKRP